MRRARSFSNNTRALLLALAAFWLVSFYLAATARAETESDSRVAYHVFQNSRFGLGPESTRDKWGNWFGIVDGVSKRHLWMSEPVYCSKPSGGRWECSNIREVFPQMTEFRVVTKECFTGWDHKLEIYELDNWKKTPHHAREKQVVQS